VVAAAGESGRTAGRARRVEQFDSLKADRVVAEGNQGGEMVRHTIQSVRPNCPVTIVHASRGKQARAEPVAALYEQNKICRPASAAGAGYLACARTPAVIE
jgi:phage terminase large subunit-like protein